MVALIGVQVLGALGCEGVCGEEESASTACWVDDTVSGSRLDAVDHG